MFKRIANELKIPLLYISTAGIFDGEKETYDDWDTPNPLGHYARSKYQGEIAVSKSCPKHLICRAGWMMGSGPNKDKKFIQKLMLQLKEGKRELFIVNDKCKEIIFKFSPDSIPSFSMSVSTYPLIFVLS